MLRRVILPQLTLLALHISALAGRGHDVLRRREFTRGLKLCVYNNSALAGEPVSTSMVDTLSFSVPLASTSTPLSLEVSGTLTYPSNTLACFENDEGCYIFDCVFSGASYAFLWIIILILILILMLNSIIDCDLLVHVLSTGYRVGTEIPGYFIVRDLTTCTRFMCSCIMVPGRSSYQYQAVMRNAVQEVNVGRGATWP